MSRTRTVFGTHANLAHVWTQQTYASGRAADGRMYFRGDTIFSYGEHYPMARWAGVASVNGNSVVLFASEGYSVSTSKHRTLTMRALHGLNAEVFYVPDVQADCEYKHKANVRGMLKSLKVRWATLANPNAERDMSEQQRVDCVAASTIETEDYARIFCPDMAGEIEDAEADAVAAIRKAFGVYNEPQRVKAREAAKRRRMIGHANEMLKALEARGSYVNLGLAEECIGVWLGAGKALETIRPLIAFVQAVHARCTVDDIARLTDPNAETIVRQRRYGHDAYITPEQWTAGVNGSMRYDYSAQTLVRRRGDNLETSRGAVVPFAHAVFAYHKAARCRANGASWRRNGETLPVGAFQVDAIDELGNIQAGCHTLRFSEMQRLAVREIPQQVKPAFPLPAVRVS